MEHPYSAEWFNTHRTVVVEFVNEIITAIRGGARHILVKAPVKSGKRVIVECLAVLFPACRVKYITSLNRIDVKNQKEELEEYNIRTFLTKDDAAVTMAIRDIEADLGTGHRVALCYDECDYGTGSRQKLQRLYSAFLNEDDAIKIYFSATAHETEASRLSSRDDYEMMNYVPPREYCGAEYFYENNLVFDPSAFFEMELGDVVISEHAKQVVRDSITADRHIGVVRTTRGIPTALFKNPQVRRRLERQLQSVNPDGKPWTIVAVDQKDSHDWEDRTTRIGFTGDSEHNRLIIIMQTCTRGTDLKGWHGKLAFWHDQRDREKVNLNTLIQAILRPCHYSTDYGGVPQRVRLYVDWRVVKVAWDDDIDDYIRHGGKSPTRTQSGTPRRPADEWGVPFRITLPEDVLVSRDMTTPLDDTSRGRLTNLILGLLSPTQRAVLDGRTLKSKRMFEARAGAKILMVSRAHAAGERSRPCGGTRGEVDEIRNGHFWLDVAAGDMEGVPKGSAFVTYGVRDAVVDVTRLSIRATPASMYSGGGGGGGQ